MKKVKIIIQIILFFILISYLAFSSVQSKIRYESTKNEIDQINSEIDDLNKKILLFEKDSVKATNKR